MPGTEPQEPAARSIAPRADGDPTVGPGGVMTCNGARDGPAGATPAGGRTVLFLTGGKLQQTTAAGGFLSDESHSPNEGIMRRALRAPGR